MANVAAAVGAVFSDTFVEPGDNERRPRAPLRRGLAGARCRCSAPCSSTRLRRPAARLIRQATPSTRHGAARRARLPGARRSTVLLRRPGRVHPPRRERRRSTSSAPWPSASRSWRRGGRTAGAAGQDDRRRGDARLARAPTPLIEAALALVERRRRRGEDFPQLSAGIAAARPSAVRGDWFGRPVNLARRITSIARPGSVLTDEALKEAAERRLASWSFAGKRRSRA